jgi:hypothetical protein
MIMNDLQEEPERSPKIKRLQREVTQRKKERKKALGNKQACSKQQTPQ